MDQLQVLPLNNLGIFTSCRACLENLDEMYHNIHSIPDFPEKFKECTSLTAEKGDGFPTSLCETCYNKIEDFCSFRLMCISASKRFQDFINSANKTRAGNDSEVATEAEYQNKENSLSYNKWLEFDEIVVSDKQREAELSAEHNETNETIEESDSLNDSSFDSLQYTENKSENNSLDSEHNKNKTSVSTTRMQKEESKENNLKPNLQKTGGYNRTPQVSPNESHHKDKEKESCESKVSKKVKHKSYVCEECGAVLKTLSNLKNHRFIHSGKPRPHKCPQCHKTFLSRFRLNDHINRHAGIKNFICPHCGAKKTSKLELKNHINYHTQEKTYPCDLCEIIFYTAVNLDRHKRVVHDGIKEFPCSYCERFFGTATTRNNHEKTHTGEKPHACKLCDKKFIVHNNLRHHMKSHIENQTTCYLCDKSFSNTINLVRHQENVHEGIKKHSCSYCDKTFATAATRNNHEKIHTGDRPHACKICQKKFITLAAALQHELIHTGKKPFQCDSCPKSFISVSALNRHKKVHSKS